MQSLFQNDQLCGKENFSKFKISSWKKISTESNRNMTQNEGRDEVKILTQ